MIKITISVDMFIAKIATDDEDRKAVSMNENEPPIECKPLIK